MNITEVKVQLGIAELKWRPSKNEDGTVSTEWLRAWDNTTKTDVHIHKEVHDKGKDNEHLSIQLEQRVSKAGHDYTFARLVEYDDSEVVDTW